MLLYHHDTTQQPHFFSGSVVEYDAAGGGYNIKYDLDGEQRRELLDAADDARRRPFEWLYISAHDGLPTVRWVTSEGHPAGDLTWDVDYDDCPSRLPARALVALMARARKGKQTMWDSGSTTAAAAADESGAGASQSSVASQGDTTILDLTDYPADTISSMSHDVVRNIFFASAFKAAPKGGRWLEIGTGADPVQTMALLTTEGHEKTSVHTCEANAGSAAKAERKLRAARDATVDRDRIAPERWHNTVVRGHSTTLDPLTREPVNGVVSETIGNIASSEGMVTAVRDFYNRYNAAEVVHVVPARAATRMVPISMPPTRTTST